MAPMKSTSGLNTNSNRFSLNYLISRKQLHKPAIAHTQNSQTEQGVKSLND